MKGLIAHGALPGGDSYQLKQAADGDGDGGAAVALTIGVALVGLAVFCPAAGTGLQARAGQQEGALQAGCRLVLGGDEKCVLAHQEGVHRVADGGVGRACGREAAVLVGLAMAPPCGAFEGERPYAGLAYVVVLREQAGGGGHELLQPIAGKEVGQLLPTGALEGDGELP